MIALGLRWLGLSIGVVTWALLSHYVTYQLADRANDRNILACRTRSGPDARCFTDITPWSFGGVTMLMGLLLIGVIVLGYFLYVRRSPGRTGEGAAKLGKPKLFAPVSVIVAALAIPLVAWLGYVPTVGDYPAWHHHLWLIFMQWLFAGILVRQRDGRRDRGG